jgi:hypothetical protein
MTDQPLTARDVRAAAEVHSELGAAYQDAVVEAFLEKIDAKIDARVDARLGGRALRRSRHAMDPAMRATWRTLLAGAGIGAVSVGMPASWYLLRKLEWYSGHQFAVAIVLWLIGAAAAVGLTRLVAGIRHRG